MAVKTDTEMLVDNGRFGDIILHPKWGIKRNFCIHYCLVLVSPDKSNSLQLYDNTEIKTMTAPSFVKYCIISTLMAISRCSYVSCFLLSCFFHLVQNITEYTIPGYTIFEAMMEIQTTDPNEKITKWPHPFFTHHPIPQRKGITPFILTLKC